MKSLEQIEERLYHLESVFRTETLTVALAAAIGGQEIEKGLAQGAETRDVSTKGNDNTLVTPIDVLSQIAMVDVLRRKYPGSVINTEEKQVGFQKNPSGVEVNEGEVFHIDPRDGTAPAVVGLPGSAAAIGCHRCAAVYISGEERLVVGQRGTGVWEVNLGARRNSKAAEPRQVRVLNWSEIKKPMWACDMVIRVTTASRIAKFISDLPEVTKKDWSTFVRCNDTNATDVARGKLVMALLTAAGGRYDMIGHDLTEMAGGIACDQYGNSIRPDTQCAIAACGPGLLDLVLPSLRNAFADYEGFAPRKKT